ncbi:MAG: DUF6062 family protein [Bacteroides sp.]|nr:DUF6062 family protein [Bacteroides sp.]MCM1548502.1 DUF6062 family protein [Clostridium sp.]
MKEQLYTIPVNDAFRSDCECPVCALHQELEQNAIEYTMGPSYMEDDNRAMTDKLGFCPHHIQMLYKQKNRLGLALMLKTHTDKTIKDLKELSKNKPAASGLFKRSADASPVGAYIKELEGHCFICERMEDTFYRYIDTVFYLWKKDPEFQKTFADGKGFCTCHYGLLYDIGASKLDKSQYNTFLDCLSTVYFTGMERVNDDIEWFINKYDYRYANEPWKNSKDAIPRGILKTNHIQVEE